MLLSAKLTTQTKTYRKHTVAVGEPMSLSVLCALCDLCVKALNAEDAKDTEFAKDY